MNKKHLHSIAACSDLLALRKAAVMAHWIPGLSVVLHRSHRPALLVTVDDGLITDRCATRVHPCAFRHEVQLLMDSGSALLGDGSQLGRGAMQLEIVTSGATRFESSGLVGADFDADHSMVGYVISTSAVEAMPLPTHQTCAWDITKAPPLNRNRDDELGLTLVTCSYLTTDLLRAERTYSAVLDALVRSAVEEFATVVAA